MAYKKRQGLFEKVYKIIREIPKGKVVTYGQLAKMVGTRDARKVGFALHANSDPKTPCHRVVNKDGRIAPNFAGPQSPDAIASGRRAFDGPEEQKRRLLAEGVTFKDANHINLEKHLWHN